MVEKTSPQKRDPGGEQHRADTIKCPRPGASVATSFHACGTADAGIVTVTVEVLDNAGTAAVANGGPNTISLTSGGPWKTSFSGIPTTAPDVPDKLQVTFYQAHGVFVDSITQALSVVPGGSAIDCVTIPPGGTCP
jgi:hypothetical protein